MVYHTRTRWSLSTYIHTAHHYAQMKSTKIYWVSSRDQLDLTLVNVNFYTFSRHTYSENEKLLKVTNITTMRHQLDHLLLLQEEMLLMGQTCASLHQWTGYPCISFQWQGLWSVQVETPSPLCNISLVGYFHWFQWAILSVLYLLPYCCHPGRQPKYGDECWNTEINKVML